ncbi:MAG: peptide-methionine (S)-S-oxide reductase MsrA [Candidatus Latescibacteria bacterium]|nr:peptide-methionine (S)-S-oxide reductase MsrA [Candidatus Latescibacterota bacterium]
MSAAYETATLGAGCFWCVEAVFQQLRGVLRVVPGYAGGSVENPTYQQVCGGTTGHAEVAQIDFDPRLLSFADLLEVFWRTHDPTTLNRQGPDVGTQYRSAIYYHSEAQRQTAEISRQAAARHWENPIVTTIEPCDRFYPAEDYHRDYFRLNPGQTYCQLVIAPKLKKFAKEFADRLAR